MENPAAEPSSSSPSLSQKLQQRGRQALRSPRVRKGGLTFLGLLILFGLLGYLWLPGFLHGKLEQTLSELLERPVTLGKVEVQPYILEATVRDLRIGNREGEAPLAGFSSLTVNLSSASILRRALVLDALRLEGPYAHLQRAADGSTNVSDLVEKFASDDEEKSPTPAFAINNLQVVDGRFTLDDQGSGSQHEIAALNLGIPRLASFPGEIERQVLPHFSATLDGAPINVAGDVRPFAETPDGHLNLKVEGLDLARLAAFSPTPLPVQLKSAHLDADLQLGFSDGPEGRISLAGQLGLRQFQAAVASLEARLERLGFKLDAPDLFHAPVRLEAIQLAQLALQRRGEDQAFLSLAGVQLDQLSLDQNKQQLQSGVLGLEQLSFKLARTGQESLDVLETLGQVQASMAPRNGKPAAPAGPPWSWNLGGVKLAGAELQFVDRTVSKAVPLRLHGLQLEVGALASGGGEPVKLGLESKVNEQGSLAVAGQLQPLAPSGELQLDVQGLDLVPLQGWIPHHFNLVLSKGAFSAKGQLKFGGSPFNVHYVGDGHLAELSLLDKESAQSLLRWQRLSLSGLDLQSEPLKVKLDDLALSRFFARLMITPQGRLHLDQLIGHEAGPPAAAAPAPQPTRQAALLPGEEGSTAPQAGEAVRVAAVPERSAPLPVSIGRIRLDGGTVLFNDLFIKPNYNANLTGLTGQIGPLAAGQRGKLKIQGKVDRSAPLVITGELEPFSQELFLDVKAQARGIDMPTFSPYSGRYMGYLIQKGKLSVDVSYHIEKGMLEANNHIFLDQFTLGDPVESPDALSIPIKLGLALLKNSRGEIEIDLPISGSINDPQFSIGGIVFKAIMNLLVKAVTSPFTLLGSLFGGGEELSYVDFGGGLSAVTPESEKRLQALAKALTDRPALTLEVTGMADPVADSEGYRRVLLERQVKAKKVAADVAQGKSATRLGEVSLTPQEYEKYLTQVYKEAKFDKPKNMIGLTKGLPVNEMETLLVTHMKLEESAFNDLAARRGKSVRDWLVEQGQVPSERVFVMAPEVGKGDPASPANRAAFSLR